jgi:hypothetical protein
LTILSFCPSLFSQSLQGLFHAAFFIFRLLYLQASMNAASNPRPSIPPSPASRSPANSRLQAPLPSLVVSKNY